MDMRYIVLPPIYVKPTRVTRAAVLLVQDGAVALIERRRAGHLYHLFPGGTVEDGESAHAAARREAEEELGLRVEVGPLVAEVTHRGNRQLYFAASLVGGAFGTGKGEELGLSATSGSGSYRPVWLPLHGLERVEIRPWRVAQLVVRSAAEGWPLVPLRYDDPGEG